MRGVILATRTSVGRIIGKGCILSSEAEAMFQRRLSQFATIKAINSLLRCDATNPVMRSAAVSHMERNITGSRLLCWQIDMNLGQGYFAALIPLAANSPCLIRQLCPWRSSHSPLCTSVRHKRIQVEKA